MEKTTIGLKKTCGTCGQPKPLAAFLQLGGPKGTFYSNNCATCRGNKTGQNKGATQDDDDRTTTSSGLQIDNKTRVKSDIEKLKQRKELDESYRDEHLKEIHEHEKQTEKKQIAIDDEKKHRASFFGKDTKKIVGKKTIPHKSLDTAHSRGTAPIPGTYEKTDLANKQIFNSDENLKLEKVAEYEHQLKTIDTTGPFIPSQTGRLQKYGEVLNEFMARNPSSPIAKALTSILNKTDLNKQKPGDNISLAEEIKNRFGKKR